MNSSSNARTFPGGPVHRVSWHDASMSTGTTACGISLYSYDIRTVAPATCTECARVPESVDPEEEEEPDATAPAG